MPCFAINRREEGLKGGLGVAEVKDWRERRERKKEKEENKLNCCQIATAINFYIVHHPASLLLRI